MRLGRCHGATVQTLNLLLAGYGMKQVAAGLGISVHTVNDYVKALHRHFGVATRAELLTKLIPRRGRPKLALPPGLPAPTFGMDHRVKGREYQSLTAVCLSRCFQSLMPV